MQDFLPSAGFVDSSVQTEGGRGEKVGEEAFGWLRPSHDLKHGEDAVA